MPHKITPVPRTTPKKKKTWMAFFSFGKKDTSYFKDEHPRAHLWGLAPKNAAFKNIKKTITKKLV